MVNAMSRNAYSNENDRFDGILLTKLADLTKLNWKTVKILPNMANTKFRQNCQMRQHVTTVPDEIICIT